MTTSPIARVHAGIPTGGQFAATSHAEPELSLVPATEKGAVACFDDLSALDPADVAVVEGWQARIEDAGISGRLFNTRVDGGTLYGDLSLPDGPTIGFHAAGDGIDVWRDLPGAEPGHSGASDIYQESTGPNGPTSEDFVTAFTTARDRGLVADQWAAVSEVHSNEHVYFELPEINEDGAGEMKLGLADGSTWRVVVPRETSDARVFNNEDYELSPRMSQALLADAAEAAGAEPDHEIITRSVGTSLMPLVDGAW